MSPEPAATDIGLLSALPPLGSASQRLASGRRGPTFGELADESAVLVAGLAAGAALMPGFLLCVPGVLLLVVVPLVAIGLVVASAALVILLAAAPVLVGWRVVRRLRLTMNELPADAPGTLFPRGALDR